MQSGFPYVCPEKATPPTLLSSWPDALMEAPTHSPAALLLVLPPNSRETPSGGVWRNSSPSSLAGPCPDLHFLTRRIIYGAWHRYFLVIVQVQWNRILDRMEEGAGAEQYFQPGGKYKIYGELCSLQQSIITFGPISKPILTSCFDFAVFPLYFNPLDL